MGYSNISISSDRTALSKADCRADEEPKRILLVEDNDLNRLLMRDYLLLLRYQVFTLAAGSSFFQTLADFQPHLILLDLKLPDIDGYTLLTQLQQPTERRDIPVIVVSALAFKKNQQRALQLGANRYLVKPVSLQNLEQVIQEELKLSSTRNRTSIG